MNIRNMIEIGTLQCLLACAYEKLGAFKTNGDVVSGDDLMPVMQKVYGFQEFKTVMRTQVVNDCITEGENTIN